MGFGDDPDKLVVISDGDPDGAQVVAFWRDKIPEDFKQQPGTKSRRIAGQIRMDISEVTIEPSFSVLGSGVVVQNGAYPKPEPDIWADAFTSRVTRPAPTGILNSSFGLILCAPCAMNASESKKELFWTNDS
jgi:hypothetical protein